MVEISIEPHAVRQVMWQSTETLCNVHPDDRRLTERGLFRARLITHYVKSTSLYQLLSTS